MAFVAAESWAVRQDTRLAPEARLPSLPVPSQFAEDALRRATGGLLSLALTSLLIGGLMLWGAGEPARHLGERALTLIDIAPPGPAKEEADAVGRAAAAPPERDPPVEPAERPVQPQVEWKLASIRVSRAPPMAALTAAALAGAGSGSGAGVGQGAAGGGAGGYDPYAGAALMRRDAMITGVAAGPAPPATTDSIVLTLQQRLRAAFPQAHGTVRLRLTLGRGGQIVSAACEQFTVQAAIVPQLLARLKGLKLPDGPIPTGSVEVLL